MKNSSIATNLYRARQLRGLTMDQLAGMVKCSKQAISHYENSVRYPDSATLLSIANALDLETDYFFDDHDVRFSLNCVNYRESGFLTNQQKNQVESLATKLLNDYLELESIAKEFQPFHNPLSEIIAFDESDAERAAKILRKKWKLGDGPISNLTNTLEKNGIRIIKIDFGFGYRHEGLSGWAEDKQIPVIILNSQQSDVSRVRFTILHELSHLLLEMGETLCLETIEHICDAFAGAVLLPYDILTEEIGKNRTAITMPELRRIKELYGISIAAILVRAAKVKLIPWTTYKNHQSEYSSDDYGSYHGNEEPQRFLQMLYRCLSEKKIGFDKASRLSRQDQGELMHIYKHQLNFVNE